MRREGGKGVRGLENASERGDPRGGSGTAGAWRRRGGLSGAPRPGIAAGGRGGGSHTGEPRPRQGTLCRLSCHCVCADALGCRERSGDAAGLGRGETPAAGASGLGEVPVRPELQARSIRV